MSDIHNTYLYFAPTTSYNLSRIVIIKKIIKPTTWEQRKVAELGKIYIGLVITMTKHYTNKGTLLIRNSDIKDGGFGFGENPIHLIFPK